MTAIPTAYWMPTHQPGPLPARQRRPLPSAGLIVAVMRVSDVFGSGMAVRAERSAAARPPVGISSAGSSPIHFL